MSSAAGAHVSRDEFGSIFLMRNLHGPEGAWCLLNACMIGKSMAGVLDLHEERDWLGHSSSHKGPDQEAQH